MSGKTGLRESSKGWVGDLFGEYKPKPFRPMAYYDKHLDCIRVEIRDCSITEHRCGEILTVLEDNHPELEDNHPEKDQKKYVGFTIKGVGHVFEELGLPKEGIHLVVKLLDQIVQKFPDQLVDTALAQAALEEVGPILRETELVVDFAQAA